MLRSLAEEGVVHLKDRLRDVRSFVREKRRDQTWRTERQRSLSPHLTPFHRDELRGLLGYAARVADESLSLAESLSLSLISGGRTKQSTPQGLNAYFSAGRLNEFDAERLFRRDMYRATHAAPKAGYPGGTPIREAGFTAAHLAMRRNHQALLRSLQIAPEAECIEAVAAVCSALLLEMLNSQVSNGWHVRPQAERQFYCMRLAPAALACGLATLCPDSGAPDLLESSTLAIAARSERLVRSLDGPQSFDEIKDLFAILLAHLP